MTNLTNLTAALLRGGRRMTGGLLAAALLIPLPAMALTYNGNWTVKTDTASWGATPPSLDLGTQSGQEDDLYVNMGAYNNSSNSTSAATSTITLSRGFSVTGTNGKVKNGQNVFLETDYATFLQFAGLSVSEVVTDSNNHPVMNLSGGPLMQNQGNGSKLFANTANTNHNLNDGNYTITLSITYNANNKMHEPGSWFNKSRHHFEILGD
jgi:hypothetical protein